MLPLRVYCVVMGGRTADAGIPVLFMSGDPEDALNEVSGLQVETDFVAKPFTYAMLAKRAAAKLGVVVAGNG